MDCNTELFKSGPYIVYYKEQNIGKILDVPQFGFEPELYASKTVLIGRKKLRSVIANMNIKVAVKIRSTDIDLTFAKVFEESPEKQELIFCEKFLITGGELCFQSCPDNADGVKICCFPKAILTADKSSFYRREGQTYFEMVFDVYEDSQGILMQEYSS